MIVLTVKTLDSQNHTFTVDDNITVEEFKNKIAETVNIPPDTQRIIYCGRVLQDATKLSDYDVNGKVVHLVQRPPPGANPPTTRSASPQPERRGGFRGFEQGNTMYLGSMAFPSNLMESQGIVPPPPTHSLAGSRLNVAKRMLRRAEAVITLLENPSARNNAQPNSEEQQEEEVTPIIEARLIVPPGSNEPIDEAMVLSAVHDSLLDAGANARMEGTEEASGSAQTSETQTSESASSTPEETTPTTGGPDTAASNARTLAENASRTSEMADLLATLNQLQIRFAPFLDRYRQFMIDDPVVPTEEVRQQQLALTRVSEVLHFLGHAYHSLSDIIIRVRTPPPRPLLCRPILIQHSAVVQAGIPIQVEVAQFNLSAERPANPNNRPASAPTTAATTPPTPTTEENNTAPSAPPPTTATATTAATAAPPSDAQNNRPTLNFRAFPGFLPGASMRVQSFPIEVRSGARQVNVGAAQVQRGQNNNNAPPTTTGTTTASAATTTSSATSTPSETGTPTRTATTISEGTFTLPNMYNPSLEFFMEVMPEVHIEVTPESFAQGNMPGAPPGLFQSLVQVANQIINRQGGGPPANANASPPSSTATSETASTDGTQANVTSVPVAGQNSQARGNTQTNPTTATHTRSTPRPHVHLAQQAMQGGFDPFLPCNSHHVTHRRRQQAQQQGGQRQRRSESAGGEQNNPQIQDIMDVVYSSLRNAYVRQGRGGNGDEASNTNRPAPPTTAAEAPRAPPGEGAGVGASGVGFTGIPTFGGQFPSMAAFIPNLQRTFANLPNIFQGVTIADILNQLPSEDAAGEPSITNDLIMMLSRNLTIGDVITLSHGDYTPLNRCTREIQSFVQDRILQGSDTPEGINAGVERIMVDIQPYLQGYSNMRSRDDIDVTRSIELLFRRRLPYILTTAAHLRADNIQVLINLCVTLAKLNCVLVLHASANGQQGVEETFQRIVTSYMQGAPQELQNWTLLSGRSNLRQFMSGLTLTSADIQQYLVRNSQTPQVPVPQEEGEEVAPVELAPTLPPPPREEPMELDEPTIMPTRSEVQSQMNSSTKENGTQEDEPFPNIVLGSEQWHAHVPEEWVPIIARDVQRQRRQNPQGVFSDAYLSGMPTKRRKIVNSAKPQGSLPQAIGDSVRRAVTSTGLAQVAPLDLVSTGASESAEVQTAYRNLLRSTVQSNLRSNEDFNPERFPNVSTYFNPQQ